MDYSNLVYVHIPNNIKLLKFQFTFILLFKCSWLILNGVKRKI